MSCNFKDIWFFQACYVHMLVYHEQKNFDVKSGWPDWTKFRLLGEFFNKTFGRQDYFLLKRS
jgi:peptide methionine sulfoxide reductase MsrB